MLRDLWNDVQYRFRAVVRRGTLERDLADELRFHVERESEKLVAAGMTPAEAARRARATFGGIERVKDESRDARGISWLEFAMQDLRYAIRGVRREPGFAAAVTLTLALGIGANAAMFGVVDRLLFRPPAQLRDPSSVNRVYVVLTNRGKERAQASTEYTRYLDLKRWTSAFAQTAAFAPRSLAVGAGEDAREMPVEAVSASLFEFFDAKPALGRFFRPDEDSVPVGAPVVVLGHAFWQSRYGGRTDVIGTTIRVDTTVYTVIGVAPAGFVGIGTGVGEVPVAFIPITTYAFTRVSPRDPKAYYTNYSWGWMEMVVRRRPGITVEAATAQLSGAFVRSYEAERSLTPKIASVDVARPRAIAASVFSDRGPLTSRVAQVAMWVSGVALIVLLIACANVANLLLARGLQRRREIALRLALGVSRGRLLAQLLTESLVLAALGGAAGLVVAQWTGALLRSLFFDKNAQALDIVTDARTLAFAGATALVAGLLTGLAPALFAGRADLANTLRAGARAGTRTRSRTRTTLLVAQGALSVILLVGAGLFVRSLHNVKALRLGYDVDPVLFVSPFMRGARLGQEESAALMRRLQETAAGLPEVAVASRGLTVPFWDTWVQPLFVTGIDSTARLGPFTLQAVSPEYFSAVGTRILRGRGIMATDRKDAPLVAVVTEAMARALWPGTEALGQCMRAGADSLPCTTIVGIAENIRQETLSDAAELHYFLSIEQFTPQGAILFLRTRGEAARVVESIRRQLQPLMPGDAYVTVTPMRDVVSPRIAAWEVGSTMFLAFGGLALFLAAVGLYSVMAYEVAQRQQELGVRIALGAGRGEVLRLVLGDGLRFALAGLACGTAVALIAGRWMGPMLFHESPSDPAVFAVVTGTLLAVAALASVIPALRAARVDPNVALRAD